jgi:glycosyltransferase involved in cell wall biosynthesis
MSKTHLAVLLKDYPFVKGEPYFHRELSEISEHFTEVTLFVNHLPVDDSQQQFTIPDNVSLVNVASEETAPQLFNVFSSYSISELLESSKNVLVRLRAMHYYLRESASIKSKILAHLKQKDIAPHSLVWYSYWSDELAFVLARMKQEGFITNAISRTHNHDIYADRHSANYLPYRKFIFTYLDGTYCIAEHGRNYLSQNYPNQQAKFHCERLGVDTQQPVEKSIEEDMIQLVSLSGIVPVKQLEFIIEAFAQWNGKKIHWHHIGSGKDKAYEESVSQLAAEKLDKKDNIKYVFHGFIQLDSVIEKLRTINPHFLVNASTFEGIPVSMMEACSLGIPIIGPDVCGVPELIDSGKNGYLFNPKKQDELSTILTEIEALSEESYQKLRSNALKMQLNRFNADKNYDKLANILKEHEV